MFASTALALLIAATPPLPKASTQRQALAAACAEREGWSDPAPPATIFGNVHFVGTCGITALLITGKDGHVLIDGATAQAAPGILANIRALGFEPRDVRLLLGSHEHVDHVGGLAVLQAATGARAIARAEAKAVLESGQVDADDPQAGSIPGFTGVKIEEVVTDGETIRLGPLALTAHATPGHTAGSTSWSFVACEVKCHRIVYADSLTAVGPDSYRFADHPELIATLRRTFDKVAAMRCEVLLTPHPSASNMFARIGGGAPLIDAAACTNYAAGARRRLGERLARETAP